MAAPVNTCTTTEERGVGRFLWAKDMATKDIHKRNAAHVRWTLPVTSNNPLKQHISGGRLSWRWRGWKNSVRVVRTATTRILRRSFPGACETVGQMFKFVWRICWKINVVCRSLSLFVSFQLRFVTYLLTFPCTNTFLDVEGYCCTWSQAMTYTTLGRTPLDEGSAHCRDLYLTTYNIHNRSSVPVAGFEPEIPASERLQIHTLERAATGIGVCKNILRWKARYWQRISSFML